jgi:hypothetical protein
MINFHKSTAASFTAGILFTGALAMSAPASADGPGGLHAPPTVAMSAPASAQRRGVVRDLGPLLLSGSTTGRSIGSYYQPASSTCYISSRGDRRVQVCN